MAFIYKTGGLSKKVHFVILFSIISILLVSGCINQVAPKKELFNVTKDGIEYVFGNNVYDALNISVDGQPEILETLDSPKTIIIAFNGSSEQDNSYLTVVSYNLVTKLQNHYTYSKGRIMEFSSVDYNEIAKNNRTIKPGSTIIVFRGPNTAAKGNSVYYDNECFVNGNTLSLLSRCVVIQGKDYNNFTLAADRLALLVIGFSG